MRSTKQTTVRLTPMNQTKASGLGRQRYSKQLQTRPKNQGAETVRPSTLRLKLKVASQKVLVPKQEMSGISLKKQTSGTARSYFKCAASRTCDAWVVGGPLTEDKIEPKSFEQTVEMKSPAY